MDDDNYCQHCNGSGEGSHDGTRCGYCNGSGVERDTDDDLDDRADRAWDNYKERNYAA